MWFKKKKEYGILTANPDGCNAIGHPETVPCEECGVMVLKEKAEERVSDQRVIYFCKKCAPKWTSRVFIHGNCTGVNKYFYWRKDLYECDEKGNRLKK